jgi:hypothetical protein
MSMDDCRRDTMVLRNTARNSRGKSEVLFQHSLNGDYNEMKIVTLKAVCGPDDDGGMCLTVMLPEED